MRVGTAHPYTTHEWQSGPGVAASGAAGHHQQHCTLRAGLTAGDQLHALESLRLDVAAIVPAGE